MNKPFKQAVNLARTEADGFVKRRLALALVLVLFTAAFAALAPVALKYAIDVLDTGQPVDLHLAQVSGLDFLANVQFTLGPVALIAVYLLGLWVSRSLGELRWFLYGTADQRLHRKLSQRLFNHVIKLPMSFHLGRKTGALNQTLIQGLSGYSILLNHAIFTLLPVLVEITIIGTVLAFFFSFEFLTILALSVLAYSAAFAVGVKQIIGPSRAVSSAQVDAYATLTDSILNTETVKYFTAERRVHNRYDAALAKSERQWARFYWRKSLNGLLVALVFTVSLGSAVLVGAGQVMSGAMTVGDFVLVNAYMLQIVKPMETLGAAFRDIAYGFAFIEKMTDLMGRKVERDDAQVSDIGTPTSFDTGSVDTGSVDTGPAGAGPVGAGELVFDKVNFSYLSDQQVLNDIRFKVAAGKTVGIVGGSGAGKSSIIRLLMRLYEPGSGSIYLNGAPTLDMPLEKLRSAIAIVPQDTVLFNDTIAYNIGFGREGCSQAEIEQAARLANIHDRILAMPNGYQTIVGERGLKLSGGEKQRVAIARAAIRQPQMFVFDEATSSLDSQTERVILDNLIDVSKNRTTLIIAHRLSTVVHADEILVLDHGEIIERGSHDALLKKNSRYAAMWQAQQSSGKQAGNKQASEKQERIQQASA